MDRKILRDFLISKNEGKRHAELLCPLTDIHKKELEGGHGNAKDEYNYIDSSTALGVNYFLLLQAKNPSLELRFEWNESSPLTKGGKSNLDVMVKDGDKITFYESKFLEPYYMCNSRFADSYYQFENYHKHWSFSREELCTIIQDFQSPSYCNTSQLLRHLLAIVNHVINKPEAYKGIKMVELNSISWKMTEIYKEQLQSHNNFSQRSMSFLDKRIKTLSREEDAAKAMFRDFIDKYVRCKLPNGIDFRFDTSCYNDKASEIDSPEFMDRYFLI